MFNIESKIELANKSKMPLLGFGTWQLGSSEISYNAVRYALDAGYRHIDTSKIYGNEEAVGRAIRDSGIPREDIWVTTKLEFQDVFNVQGGFASSMARLDIGYVDLYLVHFPYPGMIKRTWKGMEKIYKNVGQVRAIGVSNFSVRQMKALAAADINPMVNQIKCSPFNYRPNLHEFCKANDIIMEAYSPLTRGGRLDESHLKALARKYAKTTAQILLRWCIQKEIPTIPKSSHRERIKENADIFDFEITPEDMEALESFRFM